MAGVPTYNPGAVSNYASQLIDYGQKAALSTTFKAFVSLANNQTLTVYESVAGVPTAVTFEAKFADYARGTITCVAKASLLNNETFTINDGVNPAVVFEFQVDGSFTPTGGAVYVVDVQTATTAIEVAEIVADAINTVANLAVTATFNSTVTVALVNDAYGAYNAAITDTVVAAGFTHTGMTGGSAWTPAGGAVVVMDFVGDTTLADVIADTVSILNARPNRAYLWVATAGGLTAASLNYGSTWSRATSGTMTTANAITTYGADPIADPNYPNTNLSLSALGDIITHDGTTPVVRHAPATFGVMTNGPSGVVEKSLTTLGDEASGVVGVGGATSITATGLACDTKGGFKLWIDGTTAFGSGTLTITVNGSAPTLLGHLTRGYTTGDATNDGGSQVIEAASNTLGHGSEGGNWFRLEITFERPESTIPGRRRFVAVFHYLQTAGTTAIRKKVFDFTITENGTKSEITSMGISSSQTNDFQAGSAWRLKRIP